VLVVFDPLYLMFEGDVNSAKDLNPVLNWLLSIKNEMNTSVMLIHHYSKGKDEGRRGGQKMLGSTTLHGWISSAWYLKVNSEEGTSEDVNTASGTASVTMEREFRGAGIYPKIDIKMEIGEYAKPIYKTHVAVHQAASEDDFDDEVSKLLDSASAPLSARQISIAIGVSRYQTQKILDSLLKRGKVTREGERYRT
jgi:hypothetical protein